jgi:hypothetical protein
MVRWGTEVYQGTNTLSTQDLHPIIGKIGILIKNIIEGIIGTLETICTQKKIISLETCGIIIIPMTDMILETDILMLDYSLQGMITEVRTQTAGTRVSSKTGGLKTLLGDLMTLMIVEI